MKSFIANTGLLAAAFIICAGGPASAAAIEVNVPFPFIVQNTVMPAGAYRVENSGHAILLREENGARTGMFLVTAPAGGRDPMGNTPALIFMRHETTYQLTDIWESGSEGLALRRPSESSNELTILGTSATR
jgi:hypothetical protein